MNYISDKFCSPHDQQTMAGETCMPMPTVSDVSDYFANTNDNLTLLSMLPCSSGGYNSERMMKQQVVVPVATNGAMFAGDVDGDGGGARWPRQETLTLLEVRTRLNTRFKQSTQKTPLWDEVSRYSNFLIFFFIKRLRPPVHPASFRCFLWELNMTNSK